MAVAACASGVAPAPTPTRSPEPESTTIPSPSPARELTPVAVTSEPEAATPALPTTTPGVFSKRIVGYLPSWAIGSEYAVADVPSKNLTHLIYAFARVTDTGDCEMASPNVDPSAFAELQRLRAANNNLHLSISIGGQGGSARFANASKSPEARSRFASSCAGFMKQHGFDGIDIDWEYPSGADQKVNYTALLVELRSQLDLLGQGDRRHYVLTVAASAGPAHYVDLELDQVAATVDWINLMTYAFHGTWSHLTNFNAPLFASSSDPSPAIQRIIYNTDAAVQAYLGAGVPGDKIVVGVPFYGYGWKGIPDVNHGLYQESAGLPDGTRGAGVFSYRDLKNRFIGTYARYWHDEAQVPWLYDSTAGVMITYDDPTSLAVKANYVRSHGLGGVMIWELSTDDVEHSLVTAIFDRLHAGAAV